MNKIVSLIRPAYKLQQLHVSFIFAFQKSYAMSPRSVWRTPGCHEVGSCDSGST